MLFAPIVLLLICLSLGICALALWQGEMPERVAAGLLIVSVVLTTVLSKFGIPNFPLVELVTDAVAAVGFLVLTLRYGNLWLGATMLFCAAQFSLHSFYLVTERPHDLFHAIVNNVDVMGIVLSMAIGTALAVRRRFAQRRSARGASAA
ncbi:MAG: hypothetical protein ACJ798_08245 [Phenylobacterium sp.]